MQSFNLLAKNCGFVSGTHLARDRNLKTTRFKNSVTPESLESKSFYGPFLAPSPPSPSKQWVAFYYEEQGAVKAPFQLGWRNEGEEASKV